jgi:hypothetical protein
MVQKLNGNIKYITKYKLNILNILNYKNYENNYFFDFDVDFGDIG